MTPARARLRLALAALLFTAPAVRGLAAVEAPSPGAMTAPPVDPASEAKPVAKGNPLWAVPARALSATRDRPLFSPSRRPPAPAVAAAPIAEPAPPPPQQKLAEPERPPMTLVGTIISARERIAIFVNPTSNVTSRVRLGASESGWTVKSVEPRATIVEKDAQTVTLALPKPGDAPPPMLNAMAPQIRVPAAPPRPGEMIQPGPNAAQRGPVGEPADAPDAQAPDAGDL